VMSHISHLVVLSEQELRIQPLSRHLRERMAQPLLTINTSIVLVKEQSDAQ